MSTPTSSKQLPRDALVMHALLKEMGVTSHEPRVINQMMEFVHKYITFVVEDAKMYSSYARKKVIDVDDIKLGIKMGTERTFSTVPPREMLLDLAKVKNTQPLPIIKSNSLRLPPDRFCLTQPNYKLQFYKRAIASSSSQPLSTNVRLPGSSIVFKIPSSMPSSKLATTSFGQQISPAVQHIQYSTGTFQHAVSTPTGVKRKLSEDDDSFVPV